MKIKAIIFGTEGISERTVDKVHYRCHHNFKSNFLSFEEPVLFEVNSNRRGRNRVVKINVSKHMKDMFMYEDSIFTKILEAIPNLPLRKKYVQAREVAQLLQNVDPLNYGRDNGVNIYEVKFEGFLCHLAMGFYTRGNTAPHNFAYTSMMLWDRYKPIWIHVNDLGRFVNYLLDNSYFSLEKRLIDGKSMVELKVRLRGKKYS